MRDFSTLLGLLVLAALAFIAVPRVSAALAPDLAVAWNTSAPGDQLPVLVDDDDFEQDEASCGQDAPPALNSSPDAVARPRTAVASETRQTSRPQASPIRDRGRDPPAGV